MKKILYIVILVSILFTIEFYFVNTSLKNNSNELVYPLDDAYIHMAIAKNYVLHGVWGAHKDYFTSTTSSPLYTLMISGVFKIAGINIYVPLLLNLLFASFLIAVSFLMLIKYRIKYFTAFLIVLVAIFITPLPSLVFSGMEHVLHILLTLIYLYLFFDIQTDDNKPGFKRILLLGITGLLLVATRYEGLFLILTSAGILLYKKQLKNASVILVLGILPVLIYGIISINQGWLFLPNSYLIKGNSISFSVKGMKNLFNLFTTLYINPHCNIILLVQAFMLAYSYAMKSEKWITISLAIMAITLLHFEFAGVGWFFRYEAYIIYVSFIYSCVFFITVILPIVKSKFTVNNKLQFYHSLVYTCCVFLMLPLLYRGAYAFKQSTEASNDRYLEHVLTAKFFEKYYPNSVLALNDIGTTSFFTELKYFDIYGLGNQEPLIFRNQKITGDGYREKDLYEWMKAKKAKIAFLQIEWQEVKSRIPKEWVQTAIWKIPRNVVFGDLKSGFYVIDSTEKGNLIKNLKEYSKSIPREIEITYNE